jgi:hypothetical protein
VNVPLVQVNYAKLNTTDNFTRFSSLEHINAGEYRRAIKNGQSRETGKKSLKIPMGQSESVHRRRTDNTMSKIKCTKGQTIIYKTYI